MSAWRSALARLVRAGLAPSPRGASPSLLVLHAGEPLLRALECKQYGRPLALAAVVADAVAARDLVPLADFLSARESIYRRSWSVWNLAAWAMRQLGVEDWLRRGAADSRLPPGELVVVANVEEAGRAFADKAVAAGGAGPLSTRFERTFSKAHFFRTFNDQLVDGRRLSETDMEVLLKFLSRDKGVVAYDGHTVKIKAPGEEDVERGSGAATAITEEDASIAQLKELLASLTHQTALLGRRVEELAAAARQAVAKQNRAAALAALRSKRLAESTLERRFATVAQLEEVAAKIEQAADNVQLVRVLEASGDALRSLHARAGGAERVDEVVGRLREQMAAADEVASILAESAGSVVVDEAELDDELAALEGDERRRAADEADEADRARRDAELAREAEETRRRLDAIGNVPAGLQPAAEARIKERERASEGKEEEEAAAASADADARLAEAMMSRMTLEDAPGQRAA